MHIEPDSVQTPSYNPWEDFRLKRGFDTRNNVHPSFIEIAQKIVRMDAEATPHMERAKKCVHGLLKNMLKLRTASVENGITYPTDRLSIVWDSAGDLPALKLIATMARQMGAEVHVIYYRSIDLDDASIAMHYLDDLRTLGIRVDFFDYLNQPKMNDQQSPEEKQELKEKHRARLKQAYALFASHRPTIIVSNLSDAYDLRADLDHILGVSSSESDPDLFDYGLSCSGLEIPTADISALASEMFSEDREKMGRLGTELIEEMEKYPYIRFVADDGTDLLIKPSPVSWVNEANNRFDLRAQDYEVDLSLWESSPLLADNPPGEICTNVRDSEGTFVLYQLDTDVIEWAIRNKDVYGFQLDAIPKHQLVCDLQDPIRLVVKRGHVQVDAIDESSLRARMLKAYLKQKVIEDANAAQLGENRLPNAALKIAELGLGINRLANNPEVDLGGGLHILSVLITEKMREIFHLAIGKSINDDPGFENKSGSHIDNGLRNPGLRVYGVNQDGSSTLLHTSQTDISEDQQGTLNAIFRKHM